MTSRLLLMSTILLAGCSWSAREAPQVVAPVAAELPAAAVAATVDRQLLVALPTSGAMLAGSRIVVRPRAGQLAYLAGVAWPDSAPRMLQDQLVDALQRARLARVVERQGSGLRGDLLLAVSLHRLEVDYSGEQPQARVEFEATLVDAVDGVAHLQRRFTAAEPVAGADAQAAAQTLQQTLAAQLSALLGWLREALPALPAPGSGETSG